VAGWVTAEIAAACAGLILAPMAVGHGIRQLENPHRPGCPAVGLAALVGAVSGVAAAAAAYRAGSWWWLPALLVWAIILAAAAVCDGRVQRIPTRLVYAGGLAAAGLVVGAALVTGDVRALALTIVAVGAGGLVLAFCWRFLGIGFGDVRLAALGGLGLGHTTPIPLALGVLALAAALSATVVWTVLRSGERVAQVSYGPAIALSAIVAAAA
jgi:leader peptidase (prepilin peptidase) / N-methyltransferase